MAISATEFTFNGINCNQYGLIIANINNTNNKNISCGSKTESTSVYIAGTKKWIDTQNNYVEPISFTIEIIKNNCIDMYDKDYFLPNEISAIHRWLKTELYSPITFLQEGYEDITFFAKCTEVNEVCVGSKVIGLEFNFTTNAPFGYTPQQDLEVKMKDSTGSFSILDLSDEEGNIYPYMEIDILEDCDFTIKNNLSGKKFEIKECKIGEHLIIDQEKGVIKSNFNSHKIYNCFNYVWLDIFNCGDERLNVYEVEGLANLRFQYRMIRKVGI